MSEATQPKPNSIAHIQTQLAKGECVEAYANALVLFVAQPANYEVGALLLQTAIFIERFDGLRALLADLSTQIPPQHSALLLFQIEKSEGRFDQAWESLARAALPSNSVVYHDSAYHIALQQFDLKRALQHLLAIEALGSCSLGHFFRKFDLLKQLEQYTQVEQESAILQTQIPATDLISRWQLRLWQAGMAHEQSRFSESINISEQLIGEFIASPLAQQTIPATPTPKPWTRQRHHQLVRDLERLILQHDLPLFMVAGSLLSLVREGDFFLTDKDADLGLLDGDFAHTIRILLGSGYFEDVSPPNYFVGYVQLRHRTSGFIMDVTHYQTRQAKVHAVWAHISGEVLRETIFSPFELQAAYYPRLSCRVLIPSQPEQYLSELYGDWRTPDPLFDTVFAAYNLQQLTPFLISLSLIKIANALFSHRREAVKSTVQQLQKHGFQATWIEQLYGLP